MKLISSYDNTNDAADWREKSLTSAIFAMKAAMTEMKNIGDAVAGLAIEIDDYAKDRDAVAGIVDDLRDNATRLLAAFNRYEHFKNEAESLGYQ